MKSNICKNNATLVMLVPLLFILMPRPPISGAQYLSYPVLGAFCIFLILYMAKRIEVDRRIMFASSILILYTICISFSALFSELPLGFGVFVHIFKPLLFILILIFGYFVGVKNSLSNIYRGLLKTAYIVLTVQLIVGVTQLFGIHAFDIIYTSEKTRPLGQIVRIAGTLSNPNIFAWMVIQMAMIVFLFETKRIKKMLFITIALILVFFSGSRSLLSLFPVMLLLSKLFLDKKSVSFFFVKIPKYLIIFGSFLLFGYWFIKTYGDYFPYLNQILMIVDTGSLSSVNSFDARTIMWHNAINQMENENSIFTWIFGLGAGAIGALDNDYLYSITNYGVISLFMNVVMYVFFYIQFSKMKDKKFGVLGKLYILCSFVLGYQADTLSGWNYPILIMFYAGISIAFRRQHKSVEVVEQLKREKDIFRRRRRIRITL